MNGMQKALEKKQLKAEMQKTMQDAVRSKPALVVAQYGDYIIQEKGSDLPAQREFLKNTMVIGMHNMLRQAEEDWNCSPLGKPSWYFFETSSLLAVGWIQDMVAKEKEAKE